MRFLSKMAVVEAVQLRQDTWSDMCRHADVGRLEDGCPQRVMLCHPEPEMIALVIPTSNGAVIARDGDWVVRDADGRLIVCKPDVFEATYVVF